MTLTSQKTRVILCGQKQFGAAVFDMLYERPDVDILAVWSPPLSRGHEDRLRRKARIYEIPWHEAGTLRAASVPRDTDLLIAAHSHDYVGRETRRRLGAGAVGYHPSLLPLHRGRSAVEWTIRMRDKIAGGSAFWLNDAVDGGPVIAQEWCFVRPTDDAWSLWTRELFPMGIRLLSRAIDEILAGSANRVPQDKSLATWEPAIDAPPLYRPELIELLPPSRS